MAEPHWVIPRGDTARPLYMTLEPAPSGRELTADCEIEMRFRHVEAELGVAVEASIHNVANREVRYDWEDAAETLALTRGVHQLQTRVTYPDGAVESFPDADPEDYEDAPETYPTTFIAVDLIPVAGP